MQQDFAVLLQQSRRIVYSVISQYCKDEWAKDDIFQDVSIAAWENFHAFCGKSKFSTWIATIARNKSIDRLRLIRSFTEILTDNFLYEIADTTNEEDYTGLSLSVIDAFSEAEKKTLQMRIDGLSFQEISDIMGEPVNRLMVRMHRIKHLLLKGTKKGNLSAPKSQNKERLSKFSNKQTI